MARPSALLPVATWTCARVKMSLVQKNLELSFVRFHARVCFLHKLFIYRLLCDTTCHYHCANDED